MSQKIVILTGAGISQESGIKTFRDHNGLWENHAIEDVASPEGFRKNPTLVYNFYNQRRVQLRSPEVAPNSAHQALAHLQKNHSEEVIIITQNVDDLHERAGSENVFHMHGELAKMRCQKCQHVDMAPSEFSERDICPSCQQDRSLRPHIVWFGEMPFYMDEIEKHLQSADLFLSIGTSSQVYPAASFSQVAKSFGAKIIELNFEKTPYSATFDEVHYGKAGEIVPQWVSQFLRVTKI